MKTKIETVDYVTGVDCTGQPIVVQHHLEVRSNADCSTVKPKRKTDKKNASATFGKAPSSVTRRHCGQSQKDIRINHK